MSLGRLPVERNEPRATLRADGGRRGRVRAHPAADRRGRAQRPGALLRVARRRDRPDGRARAAARRRSRRRDQDPEGPGRDGLRAPGRNEAELLPQAHRPDPAAADLVADDRVRALGIAAPAAEPPRGRAAQSPDGHGQPPPEALRPRQAVRVRRRDRDPGRHGHRRRLPPPQRRLHGGDLRRRGGRPARRSLRRARGVRSRARRSTTCCTRSRGARTPRRGSGSRWPSSGWR